LALENRAPVRSNDERNQIPPEDGSRADPLCENVQDAREGRIEQLLQEQNALMLRHLELVEENRRRTDRMNSLFKRPHDILQRVDPSLRGLFKEWRRDFDALLKLYVTQSDTTGAYHRVAADGGLIMPFALEAKKSWPWIRFYRSVANPIDGIDPISSNGLPSGLAYADGNLRTTHSSTSDSNPYDIDAAFSELRRRHAEELQTFVIAHQKACLDKIIEELSLSHQVKSLRGKLAAYAFENDGFSDAKAKEYAEQQAQNFVEFVYREEMPKAEKRVREGKPAPFITSITAVRLTFAAIIFLALSFVDHERVTNLFAIVFALICGLALVWEEPVLRSLQKLLGRAPQCLGSSSPALAWSSDGIASLLISS